MSSRFAPRSLWQALRTRRFKRKLAGPKLIRAFADAYPEAFFIEIGSNDGEQHDPLRPIILSRPWAGIMVEPVPYVFERLRRNYGAMDRVTLENLAIADRDGRRPFYHVAPVDDPQRENLPTWYDAIGSLSREAVLAHVEHIPDIECRVVRAEVACLTFESLCRKHGIGEFDLLLIDTEGYDFEIIKQIDFTAHRPKLVIYEHFHLRPADRVGCKTHLERLGYETLAEGFDTWCLRTDADDPVTRIWRRLRPGMPALSVHDQAA
jgi:FkbM family methyltransferase